MTCAVVIAVLGCGTILAACWVEDHRRARAEKARRALIARGLLK